MRKTLLKICILWTVLLFLCSPAFSGPSEGFEKADFPSLASAIKVDRPVDFCGEKVPLDRQDVREIFEKEMLISLWERHQAVLWIKRSNRYLPYIEEMLQKNGMPDDLKYVPIIESSLRPNVRSPKGARGFWQFMKGTGRSYGLTINSSIDERRSIFTSTRAAISYLNKLHNDLGSWTLAAAAYNMGEGRLKSEIKIQQSRNFYNLRLPIETQRYILRIISAKLIMADPEKYGFRVKAEDLYPPLKFDRIILECRSKTPVSAIALASDTFYKKIKDLNPQITGHYLPKGPHSILIPQGASKDFFTRFNKIIDDWRTSHNEITYVVKKGDNLSLIADKFHVPLQALLIWNNISHRKILHPGDHIIVYPNER